jgi:putative colanic acid biosysnthesis UDP-glucose lipid carrier transferase
MNPTLKNHAHLFETILQSVDVLIIFISSWLSYLLYDNFFGIYQVFSAYFQAVLICSLLSIFVFQFMGLYKPWRGVFLLSEIHVIFIAWSVLFLLLTLIAVVTKTSLDFSRGWFILWFCCGLSLSIISRLILRSLLRYFRQQGFNQRHVVVVCHNEFGFGVVKRLNQDKWYGLHVQGIFSDNLSLKEKIEQTAFLGSVEDISLYVEQNKIDQVWIAMPLSEEEKVIEILNHLRYSTTDIRYLPDIFGFNLLNHSFSEIAGFPVIDLSSSPMQGANIFFKRFEDITLSIFILIIISPVFLFICALIKLFSPGPIFYKQQRIGWNNEVFDIIKFRTLPVEAELKSGPVWAQKGEQRATPIGNILRKTSLDELPQFFNVIKGNMSIVGPRPERPHFVDQFKDEIPGYMKKHMVKAGITGWAQVNGWRGNTDIHKRIEYDLYYIENWSLWLDFKIIVLTLFSGFINKNAY